MQILKKKYFSTVLILFSDFIFSFFGLIILSPLLIAIMVILKFENKGGIFFIQERVGKNQKIFKIYKFRSMVNSNSFYGSVDLDEFNKLSDEEKRIKRDQYQTTSGNDLRVTKIGNFLRKTSLDELPQLINVLRGDMSLVGPRPDAPVQAVDYNPEDWRQRCKMKPGITGMSQVYGRSDLCVDQRIKNDLFYLQNYSFILYLKIIVMTFTAITKINTIN